MSVNQNAGARPQAPSQLAADPEPPTTYLTLLRNSPRHHQAFFLSVALQIVCIVTERLWLFAATDLADGAKLRQAVWFLLILVLSTLFVGYFAVHSVLQTNAVETAAFFIASLLLLSRLAVEFFNRADECDTAQTQAVCAAFLGLSTFFIIAAMCFTGTMFRDLEWKRYKAIGAEVGTRRMYKLYELFSAVRKLDLQFSLIALVTGLVFFVRNPAGDIATYALVANVALFGVEVAWERLGARGIKDESARALYGFWALSALLPSAIIAVAADAVSGGDVLLREASPSVRTTIAVMGALAVVNRIATVACSVALFYNFGPNYVGLRRIIMGDRKSKFNSRMRNLPPATDVKAGPSAAGAGAATPSALGGPAPAAPVVAPADVGVTLNPFDVATKKGADIAEWGRR